MELNEQNFQTEVIDSESLVLVDFWAEWCGPCRAISPIVEQIAREYPSIKVAKLNVDDNPKLSMIYDVRSIPTIMLFEDGKVVERIIGAVPKQFLVEAIMHHL